MESVFSDKWLDEPLEHGPVGENVDLEAKRFMAIASVSTSPELYDRFNRVERESDDWEMGRNTNPDELSQLAAAATDQLYGRTYGPYIADGSRLLHYSLYARTPVSKQAGERSTEDLQSNRTFGDDLRTAYMEVCANLGIDASDPELLSEMRDGLANEGDGLFADLYRRVEIFKKFADDMRRIDPVELQKLVAQAAGESYDAVVSNLASLPERPAEETRSEKMQRLALKSVRRQLATQQSEVEWHDSVAAHYLNQWKVPNVPKLVHDYVRDQFVAAAKFLFGDSGRPINLSSGIDGDSLDLYDVAQAKSAEDGETTVTLPNTPAEYMRQQINARIRNVLHRQSRLSALIDRRVTESGDERAMYIRRQQKIDGPIEQAVPAPAAVRSTIFLSYLVTAEVASE